MVQFAVPMNASSKDLASGAEILGVLHRLIDACRDGEKGYALAAADVSDPAVKSLLSAHSRQRHAFAADLEQQARDLGGKPLEARSSRTALRGWVEVRSALPSRSDRMILEECDRGETAARKTYESAMHDVPLASLPLPVRKVVQRQYAALLAAQVEIQKSMWAH